MAAGPAGTSTTQDRVCCVVGKADLADRLTAVHYGWHITRLEDFDFGAVAFRAIHCLGDSDESKTNPGKDRDNATDDDAGNSCPEEERIGAALPVRPRPHGILFVVGWFWSVVIELVSVAEACSGD